MYDYDLTVRLTTPMPTDVLVEHIAVALRKILDPAKSLAPARLVDVQVTDFRVPREHPFDGPEVNDDWGQPAHDGELIFSGKDTRDYGDVFLRGILDADEGEDVEVIQFDVSDIMPVIMNAVAEDFPRLAELFLAKREQAKGKPEQASREVAEEGLPSSEIRRMLGIDDPPAEGDWELPAEDNVGGDL